MIRQLAAAAALLTMATVGAAQALPVQHDLGVSAPIETVSGGCGPYFHRGPAGGCRANGYGYGGGWRGGWHRGGWRGHWHRH